MMSHLSSKQIKMKLTIIEKEYALKSSTNKDLKVLEKPKLKCMGFTLDAVGSRQMILPMPNLERPY